jgi:hypothetical protein
MSEEKKNLQNYDNMEVVTFDITKDIPEEKNMSGNHNCTVIENLERDNYQGNNKYFLVSSISSENILNCGTYGIKIRGFENKEEDAKKKAELMRKRDKYHDVLVGSIGDWYSIIPSSSQIEEEKYGNEKLGKIMKKVHDTEIKEYEKEKIKEMDDEKINLKENMDEIIKKTMNEKKNIIEDENENDDETDDTFMYNGEDCLDEDPIIPEKRFALISFASPEILMNIKDKIFKIRGYTHSYQKAIEHSKIIENNDPTFNVAIVEIGKWTAVNFKLLSKMRKYSDEKKTRKNLKELKNLNEIIGRHKKNLDSRKEILKMRKKEKIKQAALELNDGPDDYQLEEQEVNKEINKNKETVKTRLQRIIEENKKKKAILNEETNESEQNKPSGKNKSSNHNSESIRERLQRKLAEKKEKAEENNSENKKKELEEKHVSIRKEAVRITEKKHNLEELKEDKIKLELRLEKMKEIYNKKMSEKITNAE